MVSRPPHHTKRPGNTGLAYRADRRLQGIADLKAAQFETSLAVDGVVAFIWNKVKGTTMCTCTGTSDRDFNQPLGSVHPDADLPGVKTSHTRPPIGTRGQFTYIGEGDVTFNNMDGYLRGKHYDKPSYEKQTLPSDTVLDILDETGDFKDEFDILNALNDPSDGEPKAATNLNGPTLGFPSRSSGCPICYGIGTVDTWQLYNGERIVLDYSTRYDIDLGGSTVEPEQSAAFIVYSGMEITWSHVNFPSLWRSLLRLAVYNRGRLIDPDEYDLFYVLASHPNTLNPLTFETLQALNGHTTFVEGSTVRVVLRPRVERLKFTHIEILFQLGDPVVIQMPELDVGDDSQFADWNLNVSFEVSASVSLRESSYIVDGKYKRVWKVTSINRRLTATGKSLGYLVNVRALHPTEKAYALLNVLGKPIDPFTTIVDDLLDDLL